MFVPAKNPGPFYSLRRAKQAHLTRALADGRSRLEASNAGGQIPLSQVRMPFPVRKVPASVPLVRARPVPALGAMQVPALPSVPVCGKTAPDSAPDFFASGTNLHYLRKSAMPYGRQLRGFGMLPDSLTHVDTWAGADPAVDNAASADDVAGNGIFDGPGAPPTAHAGSGVFESHFSLPGYVYREQPTQPSEVRDTTTGNPVVFQPDAGGSWYEDVRDAYRPFDLETPRLYSKRPVHPPAILPAVMRKRTSPVSGFGQTPGQATPDLTNRDTLVALAGWSVLGVAVAVAVRLAVKSFEV